MIRVLLVDDRPKLPILDGIEATRRGATDPVLAGVRVVVLTDYGLDVRCSRW